MTENLRAVLVTGANGFVGAPLVSALRAQGHTVVPWSRSTGFDLENPRGWGDRLGGVDVVVHCAARVHQLRDSGAEFALYRRVNADATAQLAAAAAAAGVRRFVFLSTAKVYGEGGRTSYSETTVPAPQGAYAQTKLEAERRLLDCAREHGLEVVILRPPLVYGAGVGGNFEALSRLAATRWPLPLAAMGNRRDMVALDNLIDVISHCCVDTNAPGHIFNVADAQAYSLAQIITALRAARGRRAGLWWLPQPLLYGTVATLRGASDAQRLLGDFRLDTQTVQRVLRWRPFTDMASVTAALYRGSSC